jgi:O-acetyl-ADP-ribose deacetylase (regulator of RNase III)
MRTRRANVTDSATILKRDYRDQRDVGTAKLIERMRRRVRVVVRLRQMQAPLPYRRRGCQMSRATSSAFPQLLDSPNKR